MIGEAERLQEALTKMTAECDWRRRVMGDAKDALACGDNNAAWKALTRHEQEGYPFAPDHPLGTPIR